MSEGRGRIPRGLCAAKLITLLACGPSPSSAPPPPPGDAEGCQAEGEAPAMRLLQDGAEPDGVVPYQVQWQGAVAIQGDLEVDGVIGGTLLLDLRASFEADGETLAWRRSDALRVDCALGRPGLAGLELFFDATAAPAAWDGTEGTLAVSARLADGTAFGCRYDAALRYR